jgi:hypothetical protein
MLIIKACFIIFDHFTWNSFEAAHPTIKSPTSDPIFFLVSILISMLKEFSKIDSTIFYGQHSTMFRGFMGHVSLYIYGLFIMWAVYTRTLLIWQSLTKHLCPKKWKSESIYHWELLLLSYKFSRMLYAFSILFFCYLSSKHYKNKKFDRLYSSLFKQLIQLSI